MKNVDIISKVVGRKGEAMASPSKDAAPVNLSGYLLKEVWDKCWEIRTTDKGEEYIFGKLPVALQYGLTSYVDGKMLDLPSIYDGLVIDNQTIYWEEIKEEVGTDEEGNPIYKTTKVLKAKGGTGGGGESPNLEAYATRDWVSTTFTPQAAHNSIARTVGILQSDFTAMVAALGKKLDAYDFDTWKSTNEPKIANGVTAYNWGNHADAGYVGIADKQTITGEKNFTGGLLVKGKKIEYIPIDDSKGYWKLEGDLIVSGGITSFASSSGYKPSTIMDAIVCDEQTITIEEVDGVKMLKVIGGSGGTGLNLTVPEPSGDGNAVTSISYDSSTGVLSVEKGEKFVRMIVYQELVGRVDALEDAIDSGGGTIDLSSYAEKTWVSSNFASLKEDNTFSGTNKFNGQLFVNDKEIKYNPKGYWELEGDLLVTGGITSFANSSGFTPSTIMDGIVCDEQTITVDVINGVKTLKVIGGGSGTIHWDDIEDAPTSLKNPYALVINGTTYDGSKKVEINISGGSNNTQSIYPLIIKDSSGAKQLTYDPSSKQETLALTKSMVGLGNVENTALSSWEGSNKITTVGTISRGTWQGTPISNNKLANSSIEIAETSVSLGGSITSETLKTKLDIVTLSDGQTITGKKDFTNGLLVNGQELFFDKDERYWKMEGNLLVTGGITSYSSDGKATPFLINVDTWEDILSDSTTQVYSANAVTLLKTGVQSVREDADSALAKLAIIAEELSSLTTSSYTADIRTSLMNIATKIK